jgi:hypothetical protein
MVTGELIVFTVGALVAVAALIVWVVVRLRPVQGRRW